MLKDKMLWMKDSGNIRDEIRQCREEGRMISGLIPRAEEILSMEEGPEKESCARQLLLELENCPVDEAFPFEEPVELRLVKETGFTYRYRRKNCRTESGVPGQAGLPGACWAFRWRAGAEGKSGDIWKKAASIRWKDISVPIQSGRSGRNTA